MKMQWRNRRCNEDAPKKQRRCNEDATVQWRREDIKIQDAMEDAMKKLKSNEGMQWMQWSIQIIWGWLPLLYANRIPLQPNSSRSQPSKSQWLRKPSWQCVTVTSPTRHCLPGYGKFAVPLWRYLFVALRLGLWLKTCFSWRSSGLWSLRLSIGSR